MSQERAQILKMLETGKISAEEAMRLLQAVEGSDRKSRTPVHRAQWLRIRVEEAGCEKVNVNVPLSLLGVVSKFIPEKQMQEHGVDLEALMEAIKEGSPGKLIEVHDEEEGTHVEIMLE